MIVFCFINIVLNFIGFICELGLKVELFYRACYTGFVFFLFLPPQRQLFPHAWLDLLGFVSILCAWHFSSLAFDSSPQNYPSFTTSHSICTHFPFPLPTGSEIVITGVMEIFNISIEWFISAISYNDTMLFFSQKQLVNCLLWGCLCLIDFLSYLKLTSNLSEFCIHHHCDTVNSLTALQYYFPNKSFLEPFDFFKLARQQFWLIAEILGYFLSQLFKNYFYSI